MYLIPNVSVYLTPVLKSYLHNDDNIFFCKLCSNKYTSFNVLSVSYQ